MERHRKAETATIAALLSVLALLMSSCSVLAEAVPAESTNLELTLSVTKSDYLLNEPLWATISVKNVGNIDALMWQALLRPDTSGIIFHVIEPDGTTYEWDPGERTDVIIGPDNSLLLAPGEQFSRSIELTPVFGRDLAKYPSILSQRGKYTITVRGRNYRNSATINLTVSDPKGEDRGALDFALQKWNAQDKRVRVGAAEVWRSLSQKDAEALIALYPSSPYAVYARYRLAHMLRNPSGKGAIDRTQRVRKAFELYSEVAQQANDTPLGVQATIQAAEAASALRNFGDAFVLLETAFNSRAATSEDRLNVLRKIQQMQTAGCDLYFMRLQMEDVAQAFDLSVERDTVKRKVILSDRNILVELMPNTNNYEINGETYRGNYSEEPLGTYQLSVPIIANILNSKYRTKEFDSILGTDNHKAQSANQQ